MQNITNGRREVIVTDIKMPFWSMVVFIGIGFYFLAILVFKAIVGLTR